MAKGLFICKILKKINSLFLAESVKECRNREYLQFTSDYYTTVVL